MAQGGCVEYPQAQQASKVDNGTALSTENNQVSGTVRVDVHARINGAPEGPHTRPAQRVQPYREHHKMPDSGLCPPTSSGPPSPDVGFTATGEPWPGEPRESITASTGIARVMADWSCLDLLPMVYNAPP